MRWWPVVLCACNQVLGIDDTHPPPPDAPLICPAFGTAPRFSTVLNEVGTKNCYDYTESPTAGLAMALCFDQNATPIEAGPIGGELSPVPSIVAEGGVLYDSPRLSADGADMIVFATTLQSPPVTELRTYQLAAGAWTRGTDLPVTVTSTDITSPISRAPARRMLVWRLSQSMLFEYDADTGAQVASYGASELGVTQIGEVTARDMLGLTPDGLRLVVLGTPADGSGTQGLYTDRIDLDHRFGPFVPLVGVPRVFDPYMVEDCSRAYFSSYVIGALFESREVVP